MKKTLLVLSAAVALSVMTAPVALAQNTGPDTNACEKARIAEGEALNLVRDAEKTRNQFRNQAEDGKGDSATSLPDNVTGKSDAERVKLDELNGTLTRLQKDLDAAVDKREEKCAELAPTSTPTTPTPTPTPEPENDVDCDEVGASEAQRILDEDRSDPHNLDQDGDGLACEVDEFLPGNDDGVTINNNVAVPSGGVATGGGPAWAFQ